MTNVPVAPNPSSMPPPAPPPPPSFPTYPPPPYAPPGFGQPYVRAKNGQSIAAMVLGLCSILFYPFVIPQVLAIVFAVTSITAQRRAGQPPSGMAITGLVLGVIWTLIALVFWMAMAA